MKEQITVYYNKDRRHPNDYIVKRVLTQEKDYYAIVSYFMEYGKLKEYKSNLLISYEHVNTYVLECRKSQFFNRVEYQNVMEGI